MRKRTILMVVFAFSVSLFCADGATPTQDVGDVVELTLDAMTASAPLSTDTPPAPANGFIIGTLMYPSEGVPPMRVVAYRLEDGSYYSVDTGMNQPSFTIEVPPGTYNVVAYTLGERGFPTGLAGGYTPAVACGLSVDCTDHILINVVVAPGATVTGIIPGDFYAEEGAFPTMPPP